MPTFVPAKKGTFVPAKGVGTFVPAAGGKKDDDRGGVVGFVRETLTNLKDVAVHTPAGLYAVGRGVGSDVIDATRGDLDFERSRELGAGLARSTYEDFRHPLRHPGYTLLSLAGLASLGVGTAVRGAAAAGAVSRGARAGEVGKALVRAPKPGVRRLEAGGVTTTGLYSRAPTIRGAQKLLDKTRTLFPDARLGLRNLPERVGFEEREILRVLDAHSKGPALALAAMGKKLSTPEQVAIRVAAEGKPTAARVAFHERMIREGPKASRPAHAKQIGLLKAAAVHLDETGDAPRIRTENRRLMEAFALASEVARLRERILTDIGRLDPAQLRFRAEAPGLLVTGARWTPDEERVRSMVESEWTTPEHADELRALLKRIETTRALEIEPDGAAALAPVAGEFVRALDRDNVGRVVGVGPDGVEVAFLNRATGARATVTLPRELIERTPIEDIAPDLGVPLRLEGGERFDPELAAELFRVPYVNRRSPFSHGREAQIGTSRGIGIPRAPGSVTQSYKGGRLKSGKFRNDTARLIAETEIEAERYAALLRTRDRFMRAAHDTPESDYDIPIRLDAVRNKQPQLGDLLEKFEEGVTLTRMERQALGMSYETLRKDIFPDPSELDVETIPGVKWIDSRVVGGLNKPNPLVGFASHVSAQRGLAVLDAINNGSRMAILYLKPAYAVPNLLGNLALTIVQQGFAAPANLARATRLNAKAGPDVAARIDALMGEGFARALESEAGLGSRATQWMASKWGKVVDVPFRRASFLHEARRAGIKTPEDLRRFLETESQELIDVTRRANRDLIDYGRLGPIERDIIRRVIFFYPWIKGATVYGARFVGEHPIQAAVAGQLGEAGAARQQAELGDVPSFAEGIFKVGERGGLPLVSNPAALAILQTPAAVLEAAKGLAVGDVGKAYQLSQFLTPAATFATEAVTGVDSFTGQPVPPGDSRLTAAARGLYEGLPQVALGERLTEDSTGRLYPMSRRDALLQYLLGGIAPRPVNVSRLNAQARGERR